MEKSKKYSFIKQNGAILLVLSCFLLLYSEYIPKWFNKWIDFDSFYSFFPFLCIFLYQFFSQKNNVLSKIKKTPTNYGLIPFFLGLVFYLIAIKADIILFLGLSFFFLISGIILFVYGLRVFKIVLPAIILLSISIPVLPITRLSVPLQIFLSDIATHALVLLNINAQNLGSSIFIENNPVTVAAGCIGVRSLSSLLIVSLMLCYFKNISALKKLYLLFFTMICSFLGNILRIILIAFYVLYNGTKDIEGFHYLAGGVIFFITLMIIIFVNDLIEEQDYVKSA